MCATKHRSCMHAGSWARLACMAQAITTIQSPQAALGGGLENGPCTFSQANGEGAIPLESFPDLRPVTCTSQGPAITSRREVLIAMECAACVPCKAPALMYRSCTHVAQRPSDCNGWLIHTRRCTCSCWLAKGDGRGTGPEQATAAALALATQDCMLLLCSLLRLARRASSDVGELSLPCAPRGTPNAPSGAAQHDISCQLAQAPSLSSSTSCRTGHSSIATAKV